MSPLDNEIVYEPVLKKAMRLQRQSNPEIITLDLSLALGHGGEARVYAVPSDETLVAKVYHKPSEEQAQKLVAMLLNPPDNPMAEQGHISIAWPIDLLRLVDEDQRFVGFLMPRVFGMRSVLDFYNPKTRRQECPLFNHLYLHRAARNLAAAVGALHARGYCIGDVNESNILVSDTALVTLVDTDSFQVRDPDSGEVYRCRVGKPEFTPPELQGKTFGQLDRLPEHDLFGLAVLIFQLLMEGTHPFSGIFQGMGDPPPHEARIASGHFTYSRGRRVPYLPTPTAPPFEILHPSLQQLFVRCFEDGHHKPKMRPTAQTWQDALNEAESALVSCNVNNQHRYGNHLSSCPWCDRTAKLGGRDPFPSQQAVQKGQHLPPIKPKPEIHRLGTGFKPVSRGIVPMPTPLLVAIPAKTKPRVSPLVLGCIGFVAFGCLELMIVIRHISLAPEISARQFPTANDSATPNQITSNINSSVTYNNRGDAYYKLGDYKGAIENFNQALRLNPNNAKAYVNRGNAQYKIAGDSGDPDSAYRLAIQDFDQALRLNPQETEAYVKRGVVRYEIAQYSKQPDLEYKAAIGDFEQALRLNPNQPEAYVKRGITRYKIAQYSKQPDSEYKAAIGDFNRALRLNPNQPEAYVKRGIVRYEMSKYSGNSNKDSLAAVADLQKAAKLFLERGDIDNYQQALGNICIVLEKNCDSFLRNPEKLILSGTQPAKKNEKSGN